MSLLERQIKAVQQALSEVKKEVLDPESNWGATTFALIVRDDVPYICFQGRKRDGVKPDTLSKQIGAPRWEGIKDGHGKPITYVSSVNRAKAALPHNPGMKIVQEGSMMAKGHPTLVVDETKFRVKFEP